MTRHSSNLCQLVFAILLSLGAGSPAIAQQGQYYDTDVRFTLAAMTASGALVTYSPIKAIDGETIRLRSEEGKVYTFKLSAETVYCQGKKRVPDWIYLMKIGKKKSVTVLTNSDTDNKVLVVWDQGPSISTSEGTFTFALPAMCQ
jgi:hypothetical protein